MASPPIGDMGVMSCGVVPHPVVQKPSVTVSPSRATQRNCAGQSSTPEVQGLPTSTEGGFPAASATAASTIWTGASIMPTGASIAGGTSSPPQAASVKRKEKQSLRMVILGTARYPSRNQ